VSWIEGQQADMTMPFEAGDIVRMHFVVKNNVGEVSPSCVIAQSLCSAAAANE
jgi:hypothetical protein